MMADAELDKETREEFWGRWAEQMRRLDILEDALVGYLPIAFCIALESMRNCSRCVDRPGYESLHAHAHHAGVPPNTITRYQHVIARSLGELDVLREMESIFAGLGFHWPTHRKGNKEDIDR